MDKEIKIERVFDASVEAVWKAWTDPDLVKQWWGPEGFTSPSVKIDFSVGGKYVYAMKGPEGSEWDKVMYSAGVFKEIVLHKKIVASDYFSDENGDKVDPTTYGQDAEFPGELPDITVWFEELGKDKTKLTIVYPKPDSEVQFQAMLNSGMKEGWQSSFNKLAKCL